MMLLKTAAKVPAVLPLIAVPISSSYLTGSERF
jgi:hypothetical protein